MITRDQIHETISALGVDNWASLRRDRFYVCPDRDWLQGEFREKWKRTLIANDLAEWREEVWDCEDISDLCMAVMKLDHRKYYQGPPAGIAFGGWGYIPDNSYSLQHPEGIGHWINVAVVSEDPIRFAWFEPQIPQFGTEPIGLINLSQKEILSCSSDVLSRVR